MNEQQLVQILLPKVRGDGVPIAREWFAAFLKELTERFGGATSFIRAPGEGLWEEGNRSEHDDIAVVEVMAQDFDEAHWTSLKERLERELIQEEIVIRASVIRRL